MSRKVTFKLVHEGEGGIASLSVAEDIAWPDFVIEAQRATGVANMKYKYIDSDGDEVDMDTPEELEEAIRWMTRKGGEALAPHNVPVANPDQEGILSCSDGGEKMQGLGESDFTENHVVRSTVSEPVDAGHRCGSETAAVLSQESAGPAWLAKALDQLRAEVSLLRTDSERHVRRADVSLSRVLHDGVRCDYCGLAVVGVRYKCGICVNYDLCENCEALAEEIHPPGHAFIKLRRCTSVAGRTSDDRLVPLLVGSPYEVLSVAASTSLTLDSVTYSTDAGARGIACRCMAGGAERLRRKLEKIDNKISRSEQRRSKLQSKQMRLRARLGKMVTHAAEGDGSRCCDASGSDSDSRQKCECTRCARKNKVPRQEKACNKKQKPVVGRRHSFAEPASSDKPAAAAAAAAPACSSEEAEAPEPFRWRQENRGLDGGGVRARSFRATIVCEETVPDGAMLAGGTEFVQRWLLHNSGSVAWDEHTTLKMASGNIPCSVDEIALPPLAPGEKGLACVNFKAPTDEGRYKSKWQPHRRGRKFGQGLWCRIRVVARTTSGEPFPLICSANYLGAAAVVPGCQTSEPDSRVAPVGVAEVPATDSATLGMPIPCKAVRTESTAPKASAVSSSDAACDIVNLKMMATSQTTTPNNTPLAMSPPKSPEPFAVRTRLTSASRRGCSLVSHAAFEALGHAKESGDKSDRTCSSVAAGENVDSESDDDCCDDDDFVVVAVPACFNLKVPYANRSVEVPDALLLGADEGNAVSLPGSSLVSPPAASKAGAADGDDRLLDDGRSRCAIVAAPVAASCSAAHLDATVTSAAAASSACQWAQMAATLLDGTLAEAANAAPDTAVGSTSVEQPAVDAPSAIANVGRETGQQVITSAPGCTVPVTVPATEDGYTGYASAEERSAIELPSAVALSGSSTASPCETGGIASEHNCPEEAAAKRRDAAELSSPPVESHRTSWSAGLAGLAKVHDIWERIVKSAEQVVYTGGSVATPTAALPQTVGDEQHPSKSHDAAKSPADSEYFAEAAYDERATVAYMPDSPLEKLIAMGFANRPRNKALLQKHNGDLEAVLHELLEEHDNDWHVRRH